MGMRLNKIIFSLVLLSLFVALAPAQAQTPTVVTGTVTDVNGVPYSFAKVSAQLIPTTASPTILVNGNPTQIGGQQNANADTNGAFSMNLFCNSAGGGCSVISPSGTQWQITVNINGVPPPQGKGPQACSATLTISGASQSVTSSFSTCPALLNGGGSGTPVTSTLMAEYRMSQTENPCALVDYSGNGNNATACVGTTPTASVAPFAGRGFNFGGVGAIQLPAALNSALTFQVVVSGTYNGNGGAILAGNGSAGNLVLLTATQVTGTNDNVITGDVFGAHNLRLLTGRIDTAPATGIASYPRAAVQGLLNITWTMNGASIDKVYLNGVEANSYITQGNGTGNGHQTNGNYQLGGIASASCTNWSAQLCNYLTGNIHYAAFWSSLLSASDVSRSAAWSTGQVVQSGVSSSPYAPPLSAGANGNYAVAIDGDSLSCGACASVTPLPAAPYSSYMFGMTQGVNMVFTNQALGGRTLLGNLVPGANQAIDPLFYPFGSSNLAIIWGGTNDNSIRGVQQYCTDRHRVGWKCMVIDLVDSKGDAVKNTEGAWIRQHWIEFADAFVDLAADPVLGADGAQSNTTDFYTTDTLHMQDNAIINHQAPWIKRAINRLYGAHDFSTATVYSSAALAATATTAGSSSATQNILTFAATPANCVAGSWMTVAGVTPAGYNGTFYLTSVTGTTATMHNAPSKSSLAAISVQGTGVCPQSQDGDQYAVLNFTGNHSLDSCIAYTGQRLYRRNINAGAVTLVPFASETITGPGTTTISAGTTAILESTLVSSSAAGCNWVRLQ
jgi:hypothetical protein